MTRALAACLILPAVCGFQDPSAPLKWDVKLDSRFTMQFNYHEQSRSDVIGKGVGTVKETTRATSSQSEKREVEAELSYREIRGREWSLAIDLKKVTWTFSMDEFEIALTFAEKKEPQAKVNIKEKDKLRIPQVKTMAEQRAEHMKRLVTGEYDLSGDRSGQVTVLRGGAQDTGFSLFGRAFIQPPCPSEPVTAGQMWKDTIPMNLPGFQEAGITDLPFKVTALNEKSVTAKGTANAPLTKPTTAGDVISGTFSLEREFVFSREGFVQSSREEFSYKKTASNKTTFFGGSATRDETVSASIRQSMTLKPKK